MIIHKTNFTSKCKKSYFFGIMSFEDVRITHPQRVFYEYEANVA